MGEEYECVVFEFGEKSWQEKEEGVRGEGVFFKNYFIKGNTCQRQHCNRSATISIGITPESNAKWTVSFHSNGISGELVGKELEPALDQNTVSNYWLAEHLLEALLCSFTFAQNHNIHKCCILTDGLFSQIWFRIFRDVMADVGWKQVLYEDLSKVYCNS
ncbi:hypothetical protein LIER_08142 [Lithospermum erythrorhizon]|uniref:Uncharacterized protein n=1 Tax=Lithospermum erythrorhizon TaxID=34254 RepID=A0AAV3PCL8_LITER